MSTILVGLDPGLVRGAAAVALNLATKEPLQYEYWEAKDISAGHQVCALAARRLRTRLSGLDSIVLCSEAVYVKQFIKKFDDLKAAKQFAKRGNVTLDLSATQTAVWLGRSQGIWICVFPEFFDLPVGEWRRLAKVPQQRTTDTKEAALERAHELLTAYPCTPVIDQLLAELGRGNHHVAEAYCIGWAGVEVWTYSAGMRGKGA